MDQTRAAFVKSSQCCVERTMPGVEEAGGRRVRWDAVRMSDSDSGKEESVTFLHETRLHRGLGAAGRKEREGSR